MSRLKEQRSKKRIKKIDKKVKDRADRDQGHWEDFRNLVASWHSSIDKVTVGLSNMAGLASRAKDDDLKNDIFDFAGEVGEANETMANETARYKGYKGKVNDKIPEYLAAMQMMTNRFVPALETILSRFSELTARCEDALEVVKKMDAERQTEEGAKKEQREALAENLEDTNDTED